MFRVYFHLAELGVFRDLKAESAHEAQKIILEQHPAAILLNTVPIPIPKEPAPVIETPIVDNVVRYDFKTKTRRFI